MLSFKAKAWHTPQLDILTQSNLTQTETIINPDHIAQILNSVGIPCKTSGYINGAQIVTYHFNLDNLSDYTKLNKATKCLASSINLSCHLTKSDHANFAIQISKKERSTITLRQSITRLQPDRARTTAALGYDGNNNPIIIDIAKMPHMLIAGATGSGKSVALNTIICSMLFSSCPNMTQFVMIDPKQVELSAYAGLPHLACPVVTGAKAALETLRRVNATMDARYKLMAKHGYKDIEQTNLSRIVVVIDELADLMITSKKAVEETIVRIAQLGRAAGIHLIIATQKPVVSVITGLIQGNIPCKLALQTASTSDSVRILGHKGAEALLGKGDALLKLPDRVQEIRLQCAYTSGKDVSSIVDYWKHKAKR